VKRNVYRIGNKASVGVLGARTRCVAQPAFRAPRVMPSRRNGPLGRRSAGFAHVRQSGASAWRRRTPCVRSWGCQRRRTHGALGWMMVGFRQRPGSPPAQGWATSGHPSATTKRSFARCAALAASSLLCKGRGPTGRRGRLQGPGPAVTSSGRATIPIPELGAEQAG
jgi:hypothetical protein